MLTADDGRTDGIFTDYLNAPQHWRLYDPPLFDLLQQKVSLENDRKVIIAQDFQVIPKAEFYNELIVDSLDKRNGYFEQSRQKLKDCDLIFYDPDNGIEIKSISKGGHNSAKYIYWDEVCQTFEAKQSVLVYQHFPREKHGLFIERMMKEHQVQLKPNKIYCFSTTQVAYFLSVQEKHVRLFEIAIDLIRDQWKNQIQVHQQG